MTITAQYSAAHRAFRVAAEEEALEPADVRVLVAALENGGRARTDELTAALRCDGSLVRRAYPRLVKRGLALVEAATGGPPKPGIRAVVALTGRGRIAALAVTAAISAAIQDN